MSPTPSPSPSSSSPSENSSLPPAAPVEKRGSEWEATLREEETIQAAAMPLKDVPSCMTLFDNWASCFALGPQIKAVYRYGSLQDCKDKLDDFKFCLTMKGQNPEERRATWIRRRAEKSAGMRLTDSSENVWRLRKDPLVNPALCDPILPVDDTTTTPSTSTIAAAAADRSSTNS